MNVWLHDPPPVVTAPTVVLPKSMLKVPATKSVPDTVTVVDLGEPRVGLTVMASGRAVGLNVAMTAMVVVIVTVQEPVPEQAPVHPPKVDPEAGVAVSVTGVSLL